MRVLGISPFHDSSVVIINDGRIEYYTKEERLSGIKRDHDPQKALDFIMKNSYTVLIPYFVDSIQNIKLLGEYIQDWNENAMADSVKKIYQFFDWDGDGKLEMEDIKNKCGSCLNAISYMYDVSLDNIPLGAIIGLTITIISSILISSGEGITHPSGQIPRSSSTA